MAANTGLCLGVGTRPAMRPAAAAACRSTAAAATVLPVLPAASCLRPSLRQRSSSVPAALAAAAVVPPALQQRARQRRQARWRARASGSKGGGGGGGGVMLENMELVVGDVLVLLCFCLYKQVTALIFLPTFPGWLAPLHVNPVRLLEFASFSATLIGTWVATGALTGGYKLDATAELQTALIRTCRMWLVTMPVAAAQLVLLTAAEDGSLVGDEGFASALPLAASGPGEPFVTAAGVLGLTLVWRCFYALYLDLYTFRAAPLARDGRRRDRDRDVTHFAESLRAAMLLALAGCAVLQGLGATVGEERLELLAAALLGGP